MIELEFSRRFAMAHRLIAGRSEKCAVPHGHNEIVTVWLQPAQPMALNGRDNMVEPFERAKRDWHGWIDAQLDHAFQLSDSDPLVGWFIDHEPHRRARLLLTPGDPTTELLAACLLAKLNAFLAADGGRLIGTALRLEETPTNAVRLTGDPAAWLPPGSDGPHRWWRRADDSLNDLAPADPAPGHPVSGA